MSPPNPGAVGSSRYDLRPCREIRNGVVGDAGGRTRHGSTRTRNNISCRLHPACPSSGNVHRSTSISTGAQPPAQLERAPNASRKPCCRRRVHASSSAAAASQPLDAGGDSGRSSSSGQPHVPLDQAGPKHPPEVRLLYIIYTLNCILERGWRFAQPLLLARADGGFGAIALLGLLTQLVLFGVGPAIGSVMDKTDRAVTVNIAMVTQAAALVASVLIVQQIILSGLPVQATWLYPALILASIAERVSAFASDVSLERDWVVALCGPARTSALARTNGNLRRADQISEFVTSLAIGYSVTQFPLGIVVPATAFINVVLALVVVVLVQQVSRQVPQAMERRHAAPTVKPDAQRPSAVRSEIPNTSLRKKLQQAPKKIVRRLASSLLGMKSTWASYFRQPTVVTSYATVILYFNAVLSPGGLMTAFLTLIGCSGTGTAMFRSGCAVLGFVGTLMGSFFITRIGLLRTGMAAVLWQSATLLAAGAVFYTFLSAATGGSGSEAAAASVPPAAIWAFCALIIASRIGLWMFDMAHAQILQQHVPMKEMSTVGSVELSFCSLAELCTLGLAAVIADRPGGFGILVATSCLAVVSSAVLFSFWVLSGRGAAACSGGYANEASSGTVPAADATDSSPAADQPPSASDVPARG